MSNVEFDGTDLIQELRLRKWAREHYVTEQDRNDDEWHSIVLDEMRRKDDEFRELCSMQTIMTAYVPLAPTVSHIVHGGHTDRFGPPGRHSSQAPSLS